MKNARWAWGIGAALLLTACPAGTRSASNHPTVTPSATPSSVERSSLTAVQAGALVRSTVKGGEPVLLPLRVPADWTADIQANADSFSVTYRSSVRQQDVTLALLSPTSSGTSGGGLGKQRTFRRDAHALYRVAVPSREGSDRSLSWIESVASGARYFFSTKRLVEFDFWQIANSLSESDAEPYGDEPQIPFDPAPRTVHLAGGLTVSVPAGWFGHQPGPGGESSWELVDHNPALTQKQRLSITLISGPAKPEDQPAVEICPKVIDETRIDYCGLTSFGGRRWRHMIGETDIPFTEFVTVAGNSFFRLIGFYPRVGDIAARKAVEDILRSARVPTLYPCAASQLTIGNGERISEATGQNTLLFELRNRSSRPCTLFGYPLVTLLDAAEAVVPFSYARHGDQMITNVPPRMFTLESGRIAYIGINKYRCDRGGKSAAVKIRVALPNANSSLTLALGLYPPIDYCGPNDPGDLVSISPFEPDEVAVLHG